MLVDLQVKNIALIDEISINFKHGLNVLTGETGAGKSIIIGALDLLLGARASIEVIRSGSDAAFISAYFNPDELEKINNLLNEFGIEKDQSGLLLAREIRRNGRNRSLINGQLATLKMIREISRYLVDIHGQHEHQLLLDSKRHLEILDAFIGEKIIPLKNELAEKYQRIKQINNQLQDMKLDDGERARELDMLEFQINEIEAAHLVENEDDKLKKEYKLLNNMEQVYETVGISYQKLEGEDYTEQGILDQLRIIGKDLAEIKQFAEEIEEFQNKMSDLFYQLEDLSFQLRDYHENLEFDQEKLLKIIERIDLINSLKRKYGDSIVEIKDYLNNLYQKKEELENQEALIEKLSQEKNKILEEYNKIATKMTDIRQNSAKKLVKKLEEEFKDLAMHDANFSVDFSSIKASVNGNDKVEFLISTNKGEELKALEKVASGGELSRIMLALKTITASLDEVDTLIFDEVDSGVGGKIAVKMADKLSKIGQCRQIICISHLPQIASMADHHYYISKKSNQVRTYTNIDCLNIDERIDELARMLGGVDLTDKTIAHANEMFNLAKLRREKF